jgi:hypothetical protein
MPETRKEAHAVVLEALDNERCLDARYRAVFSPPGRYIDYKVMKQVALHRRFGAMLTPALYVVAASMPLMLLAHWLLALASSIRAAQQLIGGTVVWLVPTTATNEPLVRSGLAAAGCGKPIVVLGNLVRELAPYLGARRVCTVGVSTMRLLMRIFKGPEHRTERLLHARDAVDLLVLAEFARARPGDTFATDDHYQRWAYVLSNATGDLRLVQHGILDEGIDFPHCGGTVRQLIARDESSEKTFRRYYAVIAQTTLHAPAVRLDPNPYSREAVFIASSFPAIDEEIAFAHALRERRRTPLIVKLHPAQRYDARKAQLLKLASHVCRPDENPECRVFVSHSSSMELIYSSCGVPTVSLWRERTTDAAVDAVVRYLDKQEIPQEHIRNAT